MQPNGGCEHNEEQRDATAMEDGHEQAAEALDDFLHHNNQA